MKKCKKNKPDLVIYRFFTILCNFILFFSILAFICLFFYHDLKKISHNIKKSISAFEYPKIQFPISNLEKELEERPCKKNKKSDEKNDSLKKENKDLCKSLKKVKKLYKKLENSQEALQDSSYKDAEKIFLAYDLGDTVLVSRMIVDFLSSFPKSKYRHKVRLVGAQMMNDKEDYEGAFRYLQKILAETDLNNEDFSHAVMLLGTTAYKRKQYDSYIQAFLDQAYFRSEEPVKSKIAFYLGYQLLYKGEYQAALRYFNNVIGEEGVLGRADVYIAQVMRPEALSVLENFLESYPSSKKYDDVRNVFIKQSQLHARYCSDRGYMEGAEKTYEKIIQYFSKDVVGDDARIHLADIYYQQGAKEQSVQKLHEVLQNENTTKHPDALFVLGNISFELNKQKEALRYFRILLEKYPESSYVSKAEEWKSLISESLKY